VLRHTDRVAVAAAPEKLPEVVSTAPHIVSGDEEMMSGGDSTSDDLELLNPMIVPRDLDKSVVTFRVSDSGSEVNEESFQMSVSHEDMNAAVGEEDAEPKVNEPIFRLASEMRRAAVELKREREQRRKLSYGIAGGRTGYFNDLSDSGDGETADDDSAG
jgi:hypothetical protein